jgi:pimeloyl-ACP methyl ester carboxylesterase
MSRIELCGYEVNYIERNPQGERLLVLLHGFGASTYSWRTVIDQLGERDHVIAYDRPGFGQTERPLSWSGENPYSLQGQVALLNAVIDRFAAGREVILLGHSAGGQLAAHFVIHNPDRIAGLILESPAILTPGPPHLATLMLRLPFLQQLGPKLVNGFAKVGNKILFNSFYDKSKLTEQVIRGYERPMDIAGWQRGFWEFLKADKRTDVAKRLSEIAIPTFVVTGIADQIVDVEDSMKVAERIAGHRIYLVPEAGHLAHEEQPEDFLRVVTKWLAGLGS